MVDDQLQRRVTPRQRQDARQVPWLHQGVEHQPVLHHGVQRGRQCVLQDPVGIGNVLQHGAQGLEPGVCGQRGYALRRIGCQQIGPAHHTQHLGVAVGLLQQEMGFGFGRRRLHQHPASHTKGACLGLPVAHRHIAVDGCQCRGQPAIVAARELPAMEMGVDQHGRGASGGSRPASRKASQNAGGMAWPIMVTPSSHSATLRAPSTTMSIARWASGNCSAAARSGTP